MKIKLFTIPNIITLCNLLCGVCSIIASTVYGNLMLAFCFVAMAAVFDFFDGFVARMLKQISPIGVQLDSLADMVSFGTAPAFALYALQRTITDACQCPLASVCLFLPFIIPAFSALRLAKFNIDETQHEEFSGLTTTANGIFCTSLTISVTSLGISLQPWYVALLSVVVSLLLISDIRMFSFKFKCFSWSGNELRYIFLAISLALIIWLKLYAIPILIVLYVIVSTLRWILKR
ncbi:MAG: CDP-alcohol phosphatidyltransferase family protein [Alistipes sp.]|nr:CDP-alcohol phosphatidyltransferase family protein [Candidatus Alistipes equi]